MVNADNRHEQSIAVSGIKGDDAPKLVLPDEGTISIVTPSLLSHTINQASLFSFHLAFQITQFYTQCTWYTSKHRGPCCLQGTKPWEAKTTPNEPTR